MRLGYNYGLLFGFRLTLITCFLVSSILCAQDQQPFFKHLTVEDGLSNNWVKTILKDKKGFMWFGTFNGLNRYDGKQFKVFRSNSESGLTDNVIECLAEDAHENLWVGTFSGGLHRFDRRTEHFTSYPFNPNQSEGISGNRINTLFADNNDLLWIGTENGLSIYNASTNYFKSHYHDPGNSNSICAGAVTAIFKDHTGVYWIGTETGLTSFRYSENKWTRYQHHAEQSASIAAHAVKSIYEDKYGQLWIGAWGGGLDQLNPATGKFMHYVHDAHTSSLSHNAVLSVAGDDEHLIYIGTENGGLNVLDLRNKQIESFNPEITNERSINSNSVHHIYYDNQIGIIWIGTYNGGVNYYSIQDKPFILYQARIHGLNNNHITSVTEDKSGRIWIGTDGGGINVLNGSTGRFDYYNDDPSVTAHLQSNAILTLLCDRLNAIWAGSFNGGIDVLQNGKITHFSHDPDDPGSLSGSNVNVIYEDKRGNIWAGTMNEGLNLYDRITQTFKLYQHQEGNPGSIVDNFIYTLFEDRKGRLLILTGKGIDVYDYKTDQFERLHHVKGYDIGVPVTILEDSQGNLWVGSQEKGLFRLDRTSVKVNQYTTLDGLPSNSICGILEDESGNLWVSTQRGLCQFEEGVINPLKISFHSYSTEDGLQGSEFKTNACYRLRDGRMIFGGQNGFNIFDPNGIRNNTFIPPVIVTGFKIFNREIHFGEKEVLPVPINEVREIILRHDQSVFTFEFSSLNYLLPEKNQYAYRMDGFEEDWNKVGNQRTATYSNLDPGEYYFHVKASNNDGAWNEEGTRIRLVIVPPWYAKPMVRMAMLAFGILLLVLWYRYRTYQLRRSKRELENQVRLSTQGLKTANDIIADRQKEILSQNEKLLGQNKELENQTHEIKEMAEEIRELNTARTTLFSNIARELKAPLDLIVTQIEELRNLALKHPDQLQENQNILYRNARNVVARIKQLLDFHNVEIQQEQAGDEELQDLIQTTTLLVISADPDPVFMQSKLATQYHFDFIASGAEGLNMATANIPDLILVDMVLPDINVQDLLMQIKQDERTSHIPVLLMTTRLPDERILEEIHHLAPDHISKPLQADLLDVKLRSIFFSRQKIRDYFLKDTTRLPDEVRLSSTDELFLQQAAAVVKENLQRATFGVDEFSARFGMSRRNVLRKIKGVTGLSINEYIRNTRLQHAYTLLQHGEMNISEVAYTVGFTDPKYFSNCFKKLYGKLPSEVKSTEQKV